MAEETETDNLPRRRLSDRIQSTAAQHVPRLVRSHEVHADIHGSSVLGQFNSRLAVLITKSVGTMWAAYVFALLALISFPNAMMAFLHGDTVTGISWISQALLRWELLAIILDCRNVISRSQAA